MEKKSDKVLDMRRAVLRQYDAIERGQEELYRLLVGAFNELISEFGERGRLYTFNACAYFGASLDGSSIDFIETGGDGDNTYFCFNENAHDYAPMRDFTLNGLYGFYLDLAYHFQSADDED